MQRYGIYSPILGLRKDIPNILLDKAFTPDNEDILFWNGEIEKAKKRLPLLTRSAYQITDKNNTNKTLTVDGNHIIEFDPTDTIGVYLQGDTSKTQRGTFTVVEATASGTDTIITVTAAITDVVIGDFLYNNTDGFTNNLKVAAPDGFEIIKYHRHIAGDSTNFTLAFTKAHAYYWNTVYTEWTELFECASDCEYWSVQSFFGGVVATNNVDYPQWWSGDTEDSFEKLGGASGPEISTGVYINKAAACYVFEDSIYLGGYSSTKGDTYPNGMILCGVADETAWMLNETSGAAAFPVVGKGIIVAFGKKGNLLYVFKERSIRIYWATGTTTILSSQAYANEVGCFSQDSIGNDHKGNLYFYASDKTFMEVDLGIISQGINPIAENVNQAYLKKINCGFVEEYSEMWWNIPYGADQTTNNKTLCYKDGKWSSRNMSITAIGTGVFVRGETLTWLTLPYATWYDWDWTSWILPAGETGFPIDICSDSSGYTYALHNSYLDDNETYESYFVVGTDFEDKRYFKRLVFVNVYIRNATYGTMDLYFKQDNEPNWQYAGEISLSGDNDILCVNLPVDYRFKYIQVKGVSSDRFNFIGIDFEYTIAGER